MDDDEKEDAQLRAKFLRKDPSALKQANHLSNKLSKDADKIVELANTLKRSVTRDEYSKHLERLRSYIFQAYDNFLYS